jgi:hypothetical protein
MRQVYIDDDGVVRLDPRSWNPAREGCSACFNVQSFYRQKGRRCRKHGGSDFGVHPNLDACTYGGPLTVEGPPA